MNRARLWVVVTMLVLGASAALARSVQVMVLQHQSWQQRAVRQQQRRISVPGQRGQIRSADGYLLATSVERTAIQVDTQLLSLRELFVPAAANLLGVDEGELRRRLEDGPRMVWLAQRVPQSLALELRRLAPAAVVLVPDSERVYPLGRVAAPVLGFVGREELETVGRAGFEHHYDAVLAGDPAVLLAVRDAVQRQIRLRELHPGREGYDLELTLDARLQAQCELELERSLAEVDAHAASAVVVDVSSGAVLVLASVPSFDPASPGDADPECWRLRPVQDAYEPGSTVKPLVAAVALSAGVVAPGERFDCRHRGIRVAGRWVRDHAEPGMYDVAEVVVHSANAGIIEMAERIDPELLWQSLDSFGFGRRPEIGFPAEASGLLAPVEQWSRLSRPGLALGQELTTSPLQLAMAYAAIANGGVLLRPRVVARVSHRGSVMSAPRAEGRRIMQPALASAIAGMLERVVSEGTGAAAQVPGYGAAGKTGTAQRAVAGGFDDEHHVAWFAGFVPAHEPRFAVVVAVNQPERSFWASEVAAPVFARIAGAALHAADLPARPEQPQPPAGGEV